ncbi:MAG: discoidin domain-containing protein [Armatimonadetes bacterium]|nr:discoidin domain-containing protein [Armatimonadota bacterium]
MPARLLALFVFALPAAAGQLLCHFDESVNADVNDFGYRTGSGGWQLSPPGTGCPADPAGRALDTGKAGDPANVIELPIAPTADFSQGTFECWVKPAWDWQTDRDQHSFLYLKTSGGHWQSLCLYHHGHMGDARTAAFNIYDGTDNCVLIVAETLGWEAGEWHHLAASWTEHSEWLFADGKLVAKRIYENAMHITRPAGPLRIGPPGLWGSAAGCLIDEVRVCDRPLYAALESFPLPTAPLPSRLSSGVCGVAARVTASSTAPAVQRDLDAPALHDGTYGDGTYLDEDEGNTWARVDLPAPQSVAAVRWSRDGRPLTGAIAVKITELPRDYRIEVSADGVAWRTVAERTGWWVPAGEIPLTGMVVEDRFEPVEARSVRMVVMKGQPPGLGPRVALDELQVLDPQGHNLAAAAKVVTARTARTTAYRPEKVIDGRLGEESAWRAAERGEAWLELNLERPVEVHRLTWSRSAEGLAADGTPRDLVVEAFADGAWSAIGRVAGNTLATRQALPLRAVTASRLRVRVLATGDGKAAVIDEMVFE